MSSTRRLTTSPRLRTMTFIGSVALRTRREPETDPEVDRGHDLTAQVDQAHALLRSLAAPASSAGSAAPPAPRRRRPRRTARRPRRCSTAILAVAAVVLMRCTPVRGHDGFEVDQVGDPVLDDGRPGDARTTTDLAARRPTVSTTSSTRSMTMPTERSPTRGPPPRPARRRGRPVSGRPIAPASRTSGRMPSRYWTTSSPPVRSIAVERELLEPRRPPPAAARHGGRRRPPARAAPYGRRRRADVLGASRPGTLQRRPASCGDPGDVEDQRDPAVAHDGRRRRTSAGS